MEQERQEREKRNYDDYNDRMGRICAEWRSIVPDMKESDAESVLPLGAMLSLICVSFIFVPFSLTSTYPFTHRPAARSSCSRGSASKRRWQCSPNSNNA